MTLLDKAYSLFFREIDKLLCELRTSQEGNILRASDVISECIEKEHLVHAFGTGHSYLLVREISFRAGSLAAVSPIYDFSLSGGLQLEKSTYLERLDGYAKILMDYVDPHEGDAFIIISNSGRNAVPVEMAIAARAKRLPVVAVTSVAYSSSLSPRNHAGKRLYEVADVVLDTRTKPGDASVSLPGLRQNVGATSTIAGAYLLNAVFVQTTARLLEMGMDPPVLCSANVDQGMQRNEEIFRAYRPRMRSW